MADRKPPRPQAGERETLLALLQYQRESVVRKVDGVSDAQARHQFVDSDTTLLWLVKHLTRAEHIWLVHRFDGVDEILEDRVQPDDTLAGVVDGYRSMWVQVGAIIDAAPTLDRTCRITGGEPPVDLRWILLHLLEETARHAGHADILRELIDGQTGR
ncbi:MAG TPA: DinB family protein [Acidimicrobiales bacterium]